MHWRVIFILAVLLGAGCAANPVLHTLGNSVQPRGGASGNVGPDLATKNIVARYPLPNPTFHAVLMTTASDGSVWFDEDQPAIGRITQDGTITEYAIASKNVPTDIIRGRSGTVWFAAQCCAPATIGKITSTGTVKEFTLTADVCAGPNGIAEGPDGNIWFNVCVFNTDFLVIGKITPTGVQTYYTMPKSWGNDHFSGGDIIAGPDGKLWFEGTDTDTGTVDVGNITTSGTISAPLISPPIGRFGSVDYMAFGPDGNLYMNVFDATIFRVTTSGVFTSISYPPGTAGLTEITLGPDKQIWMSDGYNSIVGGSAIVEFNTKTQSFGPEARLPEQMSVSPDGLTVGGDGDMWVADNNEIVVYEEKVLAVGIRLNGELSYDDPNYGFELGYAIGTGTQTQTISLPIGESVQFKNLDTIPHSAAFLGDATSNSAPWPPSFNGSTTQSPKGTAIGTTGWATGSLSPGKSSPIYETGLPGFYMIGCQYHYDTRTMRTVVVVH